MAWQYRILTASIIFLGAALLARFGPNEVNNAIRLCQMKESYDYEGRWNKICSDLRSKWGDCIVDPSIQQKYGISFDDHVRREKSCENKTIANK